MKHENLYLQLRKEYIKKMCLGDFTLRRSADDMLSSILNRYLLTSEIDPRLFQYYLKNIPKTFQYVREYQRRKHVNNVLKKLENAFLISEKQYMRRYKRKEFIKQKYNDK